MVKNLVSNGADVTTKTPDGETALHIAAARHGHTLISLLIKHGADVHVRDHAGYTPLTRCLRREVRYSSLEGTYFTAFELIKHGARSPDSFEIIHKHMEHEIITVGYLVEWWINELEEGKPLTRVPFNVLREGKANTETYLKELSAAKTK
ncbi:hypothetical protein Poli38472_001927 [Pythium oligandrum]|uniref:Uncharacterized protein n=1 Tax=Pythium oligandrum TaxID=41045 RepID=A0A8K1CTV6_PYTOL|nr:hypothetical protein Poli38472_001927 [Pythium oligandrum]|eukprot:TMW69771.1 hypothetical protein Poli38472_001927 [Pythium oligandrum]